MRVDLFDFHLPPERIALRPARPRDAARMLVVPGEGAFRDCTVRDLPRLLRACDVLVFNNTRVIPAQLEGRRGEARIGATDIVRIASSRCRVLATASASWRKPRPSFSTSGAPNDVRRMPFGVRSKTG